MTGVFDRPIQSRRNRQTGTTIDVVETWDGEWETICVDHGAVCSHDTRALAERFAASPLDWCETCQAYEEEE